MHGAQRRSTGGELTIYIQLARAALVVEVGDLHGLRGVEGVAFSGVETTNDTPAQEGSTRHSRTASPCSFDWGKHEVQ
jgi:hypothetical protein